MASWECPLLLVDMWRPKEGFERRFEMQRKEDYEREEKEREKEREREAENCQGTNRKIYVGHVSLYHHRHVMVTVCVCVRVRVCVSGCLLVCMYV